MSANDASVVAAALKLPDPFDIRVLVEQVARRRGRPIDLRPVTTLANGPSGFWIATRDTDVICFESGTAGLHQDHIILHELGHMLCGHLREEPPFELVARILLPHLDPEVVRVVLARTAYSDPDEQQAELFATLVLGRARMPRTDEPSALLARIDAALSP